MSLPRVWSCCSLVAHFVYLADSVKQVPVPGHSRSFMFDYSKHGQEWMQGQCSSRSRQSPIDIPAIANQVPSGKFYFSYQRFSENFFVSNTGHSLSASFRDQGYGGVSFEDAWYDLMYINVHALSEHTFEGVHYPAELHLVHKRYDSDSLLIVAIPLDCAAPPPAGGIAFQGGAAYARPNDKEANYNEALQIFMKMSPPPPLMKQEVPGDPINGPDIKPLLFGAKFLEYAGSTTAPPCSENTLWLVRSTPVMVSDTQARYLYDVIYYASHGHGNYRATMPLEGRMIAMRWAIMEDAPSIKEAAGVPVIAKNAARSDRDYRSMKWAKDALTISTYALDYVRNLDQRMHAAAQNSAVNLAPHIVNVGPLPLPAPAPAPAPATASQLAAAVAASITQATRAAVTAATAEISQEAKYAAFQAAADASNMVMANMTAQKALAVAPMAPAAMAPAVPAATVPPYLRR